jgi:hypothetical protein
VFVTVNKLQLLPAQVKRFKSHHQFLPHLYIPYGNLMPQTKPRGTVPQLFFYLLGVTGIFQANQSMRILNKRTWQQCPQQEMNPSSLQPQPKTPSIKKI